MTWLPLVLLGLLGLGFAAVPLLRPVRRKTDEAGDSDTSATASRGRVAGRLYQQRLDELAVEQAQGILGQAEYDDAVRELKLALLADQQGATEPDINAGSSSAGSYALVVLFCLGLVGLYQQLGEPDAQALRDTAGVLQPADVTPEQLSAWQATLERRLAAHPDDTQSWYLLGHVHLQAQRYPGAADAFGQAHASMAPEARGADVNLDLYWLQARYLAARGALDEQSKTIVERVLAKAPNHPFILEILAMEAFRTENYQEAIGVLNRALAGNLSVSQRASLQVGLTQARERLAAQQGASSGSSSGVEVTVAGLAQAPRNGTLFVIARPVGGGMPYAVVRRPGPDFPDKVRLDDAVSMNPANPLSAAQEFEVVVRLSLTGGVRAAPGDWQWISPALAKADLPAGGLPLLAELAPPKAS